MIRLMHNLTGLLVFIIILILGKLSYEYATLGYGLNPYVALFITAVIVAVFAHAPRR